jgi:hypothetical protein
MSLLVLLTAPLSASAAGTGVQRTLSGLGEAGSKAGFGAQPVPFTTFLANIINAVLGLAGVFFIVILVYAGIKYLTSSGDEEKVKDAKGMISSAVIGIVIVASAFALTAFVINQVAGALNA